MNGQLNADQIFGLCILAALIGGGVLLTIYSFGKAIFKNISFTFEQIAPFLDFWRQQNQRPNLPRYFVDGLSEFLQRRNEFWTAYGQVVISTLIVVTLTILMLTRTISAEAGLPLLSAVSGFAIAKGVNSNRSGGSGPDQDQRG